MHTFAIVWGRRRPYVTLHSLSRLLMPANRPTTTQVIDLLAYQQGLKEHHSAQYGVSALHTIGQFLTPMECLGWGAKRKEFLQARRRGSKLRSHLALGWNREAEPWYGTLDGIKKKSGRPKSSQDEVQLRWKGGSWSFKERADFRSIGDYSI